MATIRQRKKEVDIDFPLESIWQAIPVAVDESGWAIEEKDDAAHKMVVRTDDTLTSYGSMLEVELKPIDESSTHMVVYGATPVTTITATLEFGQTIDVLEDFVFALADVMNR
ncbi:MAG: hypothetical protein NWE92_05625 [Candidatus Bathyarchaeota archaeon]|nr:hypothetical protein [Candidatus Bathyarchaeota archaeon]